MELKAGIKGEATVAVTESNTAASMGSGLLAVFATPSMIALMEQEAARLGMKTVIVDSGWDNDDNTLGPIA